MTLASDPKQLFFMITSRIHSVRRRLCTCISVQQEASGGHLGGIWEAAGPPRGHLGSQTTLEVKYAKTTMFFCRKWRDRPFRVDGSDAM